MITRVYASGFKGLDFDQVLAPHTLLVGRVGSGKSSRPLALALLVTGGLPGTGIARTNSEIFHAVGCADTLTVGMEIDGQTTLERTYRRKKDGSVGCDFRINGERALKNLFEVELDRQGISIADVAGFLALSDAKKVDELFRLFPPAGDVRGLSASITSTKDRISRIESDIKAKEQSCQSLASSIAELNLPAGSLPEVQAEIAKVEREYYGARDEVTQEHARIEHAAQVEAQDARKKKDNDLAAVPPVERALSSTAVDGAPVQGSLQTHPPQPHAAVPRLVHDSTVSREALERVLSALERAGCDGCAARMVIKRELKTMREVANG